MKKLLLALTFVSLFSNAAFAENVPFRPFETVKAGAPSLIDEGGLWLLGVGSASWVVARDRDEEMADGYRHSQRLYGKEWLGDDLFGTGVPGIVGGLGLWGLGWKTDDEKSMHAGQALLEALAANLAVVNVLKCSVQRERPDGSNRLSFPSGHTSSIFSTAGVLHEFYGWKVGAVADLMGVWTGLSRVTSNKHWFSDTFAGGLIGFSVGRAIAKGHKARMGESQSTQDSQARFTVVPIVDSDHFYLRVATRF